MSHFEHSQATTEEHKLSTSPKESSKIETPKSMRALQQLMLEESKTVEVKSSAPQTIESQFEESPRDKKIQSTNDKNSVRESLPRELAHREDLTLKAPDLREEYPDESMEFVRNETQPQV